MGGLTRDGPDSDFETDDLPEESGAGRMYAAPTSNAVSRERHDRCRDRPLAYGQDGEDGTRAVAADRVGVGQRVQADYRQVAGFFVQHERVLVLLRAEGRRHDRSWSLAQPHTQNFKG